MRSFYIKLWSEFQIIAYKGKGERGEKFFKFCVYFAKDVNLLLLDYQLTSVFWMIFITKKKKR